MKIEEVLTDTSNEYKKILGQLHAVQSMSGIGKCWDNARMESWFVTLKKEKIYQLNTTKLTVEKVKTIVWRVHGCLLQYEACDDCKSRRFAACNIQGNDSI